MQHLGVGEEEKFQDIRKQPSSAQPLFQLTSVLAEATGEDIEGEQIGLAIFCSSFP